VPCAGALHVCDLLISGSKARVLIVIVRAQVLGPSQSRLEG